ncbi:purine nucleoside phosphorylase-like isoform X2 [Contarinia nasturtii]|uniref:purine nucleoside phosphorylase-like isoform X2 n=1 Tax=Contarinia nasturtii TaxID=265458 RepID=UPI0012D45A33|nr:purine nucleoside phosphorylase-like isoform X2 [Contarinia nasturtii]
MPVIYFYAISSNTIKSILIWCLQSTDGIFLKMSSGEDFDFSYESLSSVANNLLNRTKHCPKIGIICGSGLGSLAESIENADIITYQSIPNFPVSTVEGHAGKLIFGTINDVAVMCMQGRFHYYEGYPLTKCCMPIRVMKLIGCQYLIATNAAGGLNEKYNVGDIVIVKDHINLMGFAGNNPLQGPNDTRFGPRFIPMNNAYDKTLREHAMVIGRELGVEQHIHEGVYTCLGGPNYETVAELRMLKILGVDCVGMSTVHEVITAKHCDMKVFAFSIITNKCITEYDSQDEPEHEEVVEVGKKCQRILAELVRRLIIRIDNE